MSAHNRRVVGGGRGEGRVGVGWGGGRCFLFQNNYAVQNRWVLFIYFKVAIKTSLFSYLRHIFDI